MKTNQGWATAYKAKAVWTEARKKPLWGKNVQETWVGTKAQAPSDEKPILRRLYKKRKKNSRSYQTECMVPKKERTKQRKFIKRARERSWFWSLDTTTCYRWSYIPLRRYPWCPGLEPRPLLYLVPTKYIFQPCSQAHSSEIIIFF